MAGVTLDRTRLRGSRVGIAVAEPWARTFAAQSFSGESARTVFLNQSDFETKSDSAYAGLVYDLHPWDEKAALRLGSLCRRRPDLPVLLYVPPTPKALGSLNEIETRRDLRFQVQVREGTALNCFRRNVRWLLRAIPRFRVMALFSTARPDVSASTYLFVHHVLGELAIGRRPVATATARALGVSARTLERHLVADDVPSTKRLIDWLTLLHIAVLVDESELSLAKAASLVNLTSNDVYRLRRRLLGAGSAEQWDDLLSAARGAFGAMLRRGSRRDFEESRGQSETAGLIRGLTRSVA